MSIIEADPDAGIMLIKYSDALKFKITIEHGIKEASTEIFLSHIDQIQVSRKQEPEFIQQELSKIVNFLLVLHLLFLEHHCSTKLK